MRRGTQNKDIVRLEDGRLLCLSLGADFCAEHEWGIQPLIRQYGIDDSKSGIERRRITRIDPARILTGDVTIKDGRKKSVWHGLLSAAYVYKAESQLQESCSRELIPYGDEELVGGWSDKDFGFIVRDKAIRDEIETALRGLDLCITFYNPMPANPFGRSGLALMIASRIPDSLAKAWQEADDDSRKLEAASAATGIADRLKQAGLTYFALSPRWNEDKFRKTKHPVIYWLNPCKQHIHTHGWFTVEQLDQWIAGKGPVLKRAKQEAS